MRDSAPRGRLVEESFDVRCEFAIGEVVDCFHCNDSISADPLFSQGFRELYLCKAGPEQHDLIGGADSFGDLLVELSRFVRPALTLSFLR